MTLTLAVALTLSGITLHGATTCPTPEQVDARLAGLVADDPSEARQVELRTNPGSLELRLSLGEKLDAVRVLPTGASCDALAEASAVAIATWASRPAPRAVVPTAVPAPVPDRPQSDRIFSPAALSSAREITARPDAVRSRSLVGPLLLLGLAAASSASALALLIANPSPNHDANLTIGISVALVMVGVTGRACGLMWLLQQFATTPHDEAVTTARGAL